MKKIYLLLIILLGLNVFANDITIKLNAKSKMEVSANSAKINFLIKSSGNSLEEIQSENSKNMDNFLKELENNSIKYENLSTDDYRYYKSYEVDVQKVEKEYITTVKFKVLSDISESSTIVELLEETNISKYKINTNEIIFEIEEKGLNVLDNLNKIKHRIDELKNKMNRNLVMLFSENIETVKEERKEKYVISTNFSLNLKDLDKINNLIEIAQKYNINIEGNINYYISNLSTFYDELYKKSYDIAKNKAKNLTSSDAKLEVKKISENRYAVEKMNNLVEDKNIQEVYALRSMSLAKVENNIDFYDDFSNNYSEKLNLTIPKLEIENNLEIEYILKNNIEVKDANKIVSLYSKIDKKINPDTIELFFNINTDSEESLEEASKTNAKILDKLKKILEEANLGYESFETYSYNTNTDEYKTTEVKITGDIENKAIILANLEGVNDSNYYETLKTFFENDVKIINGDKVYIKIEKVAQGVKEAYNLANIVFEKIKKDLSKLGVVLKLAEYENKKNEKTEIIEKNVKVYEINHELKLKIKDLKNISILVSIVRELGLDLNKIKYSLENKKDFEEIMYAELRKDFENKKEALEKIEDIKILDIKNISDNSNDFANPIYKTMYNNSKLNVNIEEKNSNIIKRAYNNLENIHIPKYNLSLGANIEYILK